MDGMKTGKRRTHGLDVEDTAHNKRKRKREVEVDHSDSVQIVGETHPPVESHVQTRTTAYLDESDDRMDRMGYVQLWINSIPEDAPLWAQTSRNHLVRIGRDQSYPEEEDGTSSEEAFDQSANSHLHPGGSTNTTSSSHPPPPPNLLTPSTTTDRSVAPSPHHSKTHHHSSTNGVRVSVAAAAAAVAALRMLGTTTPTNQPTATADWHPRSGQHFAYPQQPRYAIGQHGSSNGLIAGGCESESAAVNHLQPPTGTGAGRLFDDTEMALIVKASFMKSAEFTSLHNHLNLLLAGADGSPVVHTLVDAIQSFFISSTSSPSIDPSSCLGNNSSGLSPQSASTNSYSTQDAKVEIYHGETIVDRKSVFQAHCCAIDCIDRVKQFVEQLKADDKKVASATHNVLAWTFNIGRGESTSLTASDCDDDGEQYAGSRLLQLLKLSKANNVAVVVSRWFGGILLGPDRFKHINDAARQLLVQQGFITSGGSQKPLKKKTKRK